MPHYNANQYTKNQLTPGDLNWVQHWVSRIGLLCNKRTKSAVVSFKMRKKHYFFHDLIVEQTSSWPIVYTFTKQTCNILRHNNVIMFALPKLRPELNEDDSSCMASALNLDFWKHENECIKATGQWQIQSINVVQHLVQWNLDITKGPRNWQNLFAITRFCYIKALLNILL